MPVSVYQLTSLILTVLAVIPCSCEDDQCDSKGICNDHANDEVAALQVHLSSSKAVIDSDSHTKRLAEAEKEFHVQLNANLDLPVNSTQREEFNLKGDLSATPEMTPGTRFEPRIQKLGHDPLEFNDFVQADYKMTAAMPTVFNNEKGASLVLVMLALASAAIFAIAMVYSPSKPNKKAAGEITQNVDVPWYYCGLWAIVMMLGAMSSSALVTGFPDMAAELHASPAMVSLMMPLNSGVRGVADLLLGVLSDWYGQKKMLLICMVLYLTGTVISMCAPTIEVLLVGQFVRGIGEATTAVVQSSVRRVVDDPVKRQRVLGILSSLEPPIVFFSPILGSVMVAFIGWRSIFGALLLLSAATFLGYIYIIPETHDDTPSEPVLTQFASILCNQDQLSLLVPYCVSFAMMFCTMCNVSFILDGFGVSTIHQGIFLSSMGLYFGIGASTTQKYFFREDQSLVRTLKTAMSVQCFLWITTFSLGIAGKDSKWIVIGVLYSTFIGTGMVAPTITNLYLQPLRDVSGLASGIMWFLRAVIQSCLSPVTVIELQDHGIGAMLLSMLVIHLASQTVFWIGYLNNGTKWASQLPASARNEGETQDES